MRLRESNRTDCKAKRLHSDCRGRDSDERQAGRDRQNGTYDEDLMVITILETPECGSRAFLLDLVREGFRR